MKGLDTFFQVFIEVLFWILLVWLLAQFILKFLGHSPTDIQVLYGGFVAIVAYLLEFSFRMGRFTGKVEEFMIVSKHSFTRLRAEVHDIRAEVHEIKEKLT